MNKCISTYFPKDTFGHMKVRHQPRDNGGLIFFFIFIIKLYAAITKTNTYNIIMPPNIIKKYTHSGNFIILSLLVIAVRVMGTDYYRMII